MELKRRFSFRKTITILYIVSFLVFIAVGLMPVEATAETVDGGLAIPSIGLNSDVTSLELENHKLNTPDKIVGSYTQAENKIFLIGHSSTVFKNLKNVKQGDAIYYNGTAYNIVDTKVQKKSDVDMKDILKAEEVETVVIMTCSGEPVGEKDATHRLIVTAVSAA